MMKLCLLAIGVLLAAVQASLPLQDATAYVDQLFIHQIDSTDFSTKNIQVTESGRDELPHWLRFDSATLTLKGFPTAKDRGTYILAVGPEGSTDHEVFAVTVAYRLKHEVAQPADSKEDVVVCKPHESLTLVTVMINSDPEQLDAALKAGLVEAMTSHLSLQPRQLSLKPKGDKVSDSPPLVSGPGDSRPDPELRDSSIISWVAGCGSVKSHQMDILERLESSAKNGMLTKVLGRGVVGWQVSSEAPKIIKTRRLKRQIVVTASPSVPEPEEIQSTPTPTDVTTRPDTPDTPDATATKESTVVSKEPTRVTRSTKAVMTTIITVPPPTPPPSPWFSSTRTQDSTTVDPFSLTSTRLVEEMTADTTPSAPTTPPPVTPPPPQTNKAPKLNEEKTPGKQEARVGELYEYVIPADLFIDEDGDDITYSVQNYAAQTDVNSPNSWVLFDAAKKTIYYVPTEDSISLNKFSIVATDSRGNSGRVMFDIQVMEKDTDGVSMFYKLDLKSPFMGKPQEVVALAVELSAKDILSKIIIDEVKGGMVTLGENLGGQACSDEPDKANTARSRLQMHQITLPLISENVPVGNDLRLMPVSPCENQAPELGPTINTVQDIQAVFGKLLEMEVPVDAFIDDEDINLKYMSINLVLKGLSNRPSSSNWVSLNSKTRLIQALAWDEVEPSQYELEATDSMGKTVRSAINVELTAPYSEEETHEFAITIDENHSKFANNHAQQVKLYKELNSVYPDSTLFWMRVKDGSVVVTYKLENDDTAAAPSGGCPKAGIEKMMAKMFDGDAVKDSFANRIPNLKSVDFIPIGSCDGEMEPKSAAVARPTPDQTGKSEDGNTTIIIIIVVVVVIVIIIIIIVVVIVLRRKRKEQMNVSKNNGTYIEKGVPVVFDEEMKGVTKQSQEEQPLMAGQPAPPSYPQNGAKTGNGANDSYQPPTPPVSEPDENRQQYDKSP